MPNDMSLCPICEEPMTRADVHLPDHSLEELLEFRSRFGYSRARSETEEKVSVVRSVYETLQTILGFAHFGTSEDIEQANIRFERWVRTCSSSNLPKKDRSASIPN